MCCVYYRYSAVRGNALMGSAALVVPFVACGDLNGLDADKSYPLQLEETGDTQTQQQLPTAPTDSAGGEGKGYQYVYRPPAQPPINPNYHTYQQRTAAATAASSSYTSSK